MESSTIIPNIVNLFLLVDSFVFLLYYTWRIHKINYETSVMEDKMVIAMISTIGIKIATYTGHLFNVNDIAFNSLIYLGDLGLVFVAIMMALVVQDIVKKQRRINSKH